MSDKLGFEELRLKYKDILSKAFSTNNIDLLDSFSRNTNEVDRKAAMDQAFRDKLLELLIENPDTLENYVSFCIESCRRHMVTPTMPVVLLGDIFDALTLNKCEKLFEYVEKGVNIWKEELFFVACKNNLLRMCNDLLRRLSRSQNTVFCGRILLFLAKFFPFSERSGLNIVSEFNLENVTEFGGDNSSTLKDALDEDMVVDEDNSKLTIDYSLYCRFWSLQDFFRNPNTCYNKIQWKTFVAHSGSVLAAFSSYKLEAVELQKSKLNRLKAVNSDVEMQESNKEQHYFAKEAQELKSVQVDWIKETTAMIYRLLGETPPDGKKFAECVKCILHREEYWNSWKNDGCPEFQKPKAPVSVDSDEVKKTRKRRRPVGDIINEYRNQDKFYMGNNELTKLWNLCPDNLVACRTKERDFMPSLESYMLSEGGTGGARRTASGGWGWRALRLLARRSPHFFVHTNNPIGRLPDYLDDMVKRIARDSAANAAAANANGDTNTNHNDKAVKQEAVEEEITEEQMEADLIKGADSNDIEQVPDSTEGGDNDEKTTRSRVTMISPAELDAVSAKLSEWKKLAVKLGYKPDEIQYFETENATDEARAKNMLQLWFDDDEDASVENLLYIMEGLKLVDACEALKNAK
ncbi:THO complex subunit 1 [Papilio machaon]|uniref:THO complex subunit 1 n=1 Tax=Papilio machaon TaxID=76193 RepID=A0A194R543_PAPMA|nr:THO complex subunit 1 [Papilio machaon]